MGACFAKQRDRRPRTVLDIQIVSYYNMGLIAKTFLDGVPTDSAMSFTLKSVEDFHPSPFFTMENLTRILYSVMKSTEGLCGVTIKVQIDGEPKLFKFRAPSCPKHMEKTVSLKLSRGEHIIKLRSGSNDSGIQALKIYTTHQTVKLGNVYSYEHQAELDESASGRAVIGFHLGFNDKILVEFSVYTAPLLRKRAPPSTLKRNRVIFVQSH